MDSESKEQHVHRVFQSIAHRYDYMNSLLSFRMHRRWRQFAMKKMHVQPGQTAVDVCCGTCDWAISLADHVGKDGYVTGVDFSENMLQIGKQKCRQHELNNIHLQVGNAMDLPYADDSFDHATIGFALRNVPDIRHVLTEMHRVTKPGGQVVSLELSKPVWPVFRQVYYAYFNYVLPFFGKLFANRYKQYSWLPASLRDFPDSNQLANIFSEVGFEHVRTYLLTGGVAAVHIGRKKGSSRHE